VAKARDNTKDPSSNESDSESDSNDKKPNKELAQVISFFKEVCTKQKKFSSKC
jgi:hypothetical protein